MFAFEKYTEMSDPWPWPREGPGALKDRQILDTSRAMAASLAQSREHVVNWDQLDLKRYQTREEGLGLAPTVPSPRPSVYIPDTAFATQPHATEVSDNPIDEPTSPTEVDELTPSTSVATVTAPLPEDTYDEMVDVGCESVEHGSSDLDFNTPPLKRRDTVRAAMATLRATGRLIPGLCN